jgi:hypothetical protein
MSERYIDPVTRYYMQFVDREALRENLKLTVEQRINKLQQRLKEHVERDRAETSGASPWIEERILPCD